VKVLTHRQPPSVPGRHHAGDRCNPGGGTLGGTATRTASGGVATFDDLTIDNQGVDYTLVASSTIPSAGLFTIADVDAVRAERRLHR
jgi:hypothetical protein